MEISHITTHWTTSDGTEGFIVGSAGVTEIKEVEKNGLHCHIPYIEVYKGEKLFASFCRHNIVGVYYK